MQAKTIAIRLLAARLDNPDLDMRYVLPDLLVQRSGGSISSDGYDYVGSENELVLYLSVRDTTTAIAHITDVIDHVRVLSNDLRGAVSVAIDAGDRFEVVYPPGAADEDADTWRNA
jgi:hypothetical protein